MVYKETANQSGKIHANFCHAHVNGILLYRVLSTEIEVFQIIIPSHL
jgi:hypothetical protein